MGAPATSHQPRSAEGLIGLRGWRVAELVPDLMRWCASLSQLLNVAHSLVFVTAS